MNITDLIDRELEKVGDKDSAVVEFSRELMKSFGYRVLAEISRLNHPAFTCTDDIGLSKQGFGNMLLNYLVDKNDELYGKKNFKFPEYKAWKDAKEITPNIHDHLVIVRREGGKLDFARFDKSEKWIDQDGKELSDVVEWSSYDQVTDL